jgi:carboxyl-terminal processing protease
MSKKIQVLLLTTSMLVIVFALIGGLGVHAASGNNSDNAYTHMQVYSEVLHRIRTEYVEEPNMGLVTGCKLQLSDPG